MAPAKSDRISVSPSNSDHHHHHHRSCPSLLHAFDEIVKDIDNIPEFLRAQKATLRFPEVLLFLMVQAERDAVNSGCSVLPCIGWTFDGQAVIIRNKDELLNKMLPLAFSTVCSKFTSFTRKMYRWGFRQASSGDAVNNKQGGQCSRTSVIIKDNNNNKRKTNSSEIIFFHPFFQRDNKALAASMTSTTAEGTRRALSAAKKLPKKRQHKGIVVSQPQHDVVREAGRQQHEHNGVVSQILDQMDKIEPSLGLFAAINSTDANRSQDCAQGRQSIGMDPYAMKSSPTEEAVIDDAARIMSNIFPHRLQLMVTPHILMPSTSSFHSRHNYNAITFPSISPSPPNNINSLMSHHLLTIPSPATAAIFSADNTSSGLHGLGPNDHQQALLPHQLLVGSHISQMVEEPFIQHALQQLLIIQQQQQSILPTSSPPDINDNGLFPENISSVQTSGWQQLR